VRRASLASKTAGVAVAAAVLALPLLVSDRYIMKILTFAGINALIVIGLSLLFGYAGQISLGHAAFFGLGAYTCGVLTSAHAWPWPLAALAATVVAATGGLALALPSLRLRGHYLAMATLGFSEIALVGFTELKSVTGGTDGLSGIPYATMGPLKIATPAGNYLLVWAVVVVAFVLARNMVVSRPGRALRALHGSEAGARACGIDISRTKVQVFTLSAALAGLAGALYASYVGFISPSSFTLALSISLVAMVALGGMGSLPGAVLAAVGLTLLPFMNALLPGLPPAAVAFLQDWNTDIYGLVLILVMLFMPGGLAGAFRRLARRLRAQAAGEGGRA
jgi:branched-chain amino acid transport system permease protein